MRNLHRLVVFLLFFAAEIFHSVHHVSLEIGELVVIFSAHIAGGEDKISGGTVVCNGDIVNLGDTQQRLYVGIVGLCGEGIGEKDDDIDLSVHDACTYLLVAAERSAVIAADGQLRAVCDHSCGCACAV